MQACAAGKMAAHVFLSAYFSMETYILHAGSESVKIYND